MVTSSLHRPSDWLRRFQHLLLEGSGQVLDLACGTGRNSFYLNSLGLSVLALDRDTHSLPAMLAAGIATKEHDLELGDAGYDWPFADHSFAAIVVCNYLHRPLFPHLLASLKPDGLLIYETFAAGNENFGKPSNPAFLLRPGELLAQMQSNPEVTMSIVAYEDCYVEQPKPAMVQRICARKTEKISVLDKL
ncbi:MAG: class I SAM-dependent methyltransferase [Burkholderiales bacterium]|nr:class I SAM-dependent methyltransferase [Burkholderiales bacterium]MBI3730707.1 class I SAM-dependent methyltransferase [Burkholderiales bacterium]